MKKLVAVLVLTIVAAGCGSSAKTTTTQSSGNLAGTYSIVVSEPGNPSVSYTATLVNSQCSIDAPDAGTFTVIGPACALADNETSQGGISSTDSTFTPQGVLLGTPGEPLSGSSPVNFLFVETAGDTLLVFVGGGTYSNGQITGTWGCYPGLSSCQGLTGTFTATQR